MSDTPHRDDWAPYSTASLEKPLETFDHMRRHCPVAHSHAQGWTVFRHADLLGILNDHQGFSNEVSRHRSVPNGMDPPEHTPYRQLIEPFFSPERMDRFEPECRKIASLLACKVAGRHRVEVISELAEDFALQIQCAFLGWPVSLQEPLRQWAHENHRATLAGDRQAMNEIAQRFSQYIRDLLADRRRQGEQAPEDITTELMNSRTNGELIPEEDIVSLLRNWTVGEIGTISASVGIILYFLTQDEQLQTQLRESPECIPEAVEEILRIHGPLITNRRKATHETLLGERTIAAGDTLTLNWVSANRDEAVFPEPHRFRWGRDHRQNLLYGAGLHVCPGAPLARLELRILLEELLQIHCRFRLTPGATPVTAHYPASGYQALWLNFQ